MKSCDRSKFAEIVMSMAEVHRVEMSDPALRLYWRSMQDWPLNEFERAAAHLLKQKVWMPKPSDFNELLRGSAIPAQEAWAKALEHAAGGYRSGPVEDMIINETVQRMGGFVSIAMCHESQIEWKKRDFLELYETVVDQQLAAGKLPLNLPRLPDRLGKALSYDPEA